MNPIFLKLGPINIYWYSIFIMIALIIGYYLIKIESEKHDISSNLIIDLIFYVIPISIICARIYYVIFNLDYYSVNPEEIFYIWNGGLAIHGGIIGGLLTIFYFCKQKNISFFLMTDIISPVLLLGQSIGRWGNFMNSEAFGNETTISTLHNLMIPDFVIKGMNINGTYYLPTFYFESIGCLLGFIVITFIRKRKNIKIGTTTGLYFIWYGILRFFIESYRTDSLMIGDIKMAMIISGIMFIVGIIIVYRSIKRNQIYHKENDA